MAIVTDKLRIINCSNFINDLSGGSYYAFIGLPNSQSIYPNWDSTKPNPTDNTTYLNSYRESILGIKQITSSDVVRVIPKITWASGKKYDMYRHDYSVTNTSPVTSATRLYDSQFYVVNSEYRVYICINNGAIPALNIKSVVSTQEPLHTSTSPILESDGYMWKYLYTLSPADVIKFDSTNYISVPNNWTTSTNEDISRVRGSAVAGKIETILIDDNSTLYPPFIPEGEEGGEIGVYTNVPIKGDGSGGLATVKVDESGKVSKVTVINGGSGYTYATLDLNSVIQPTTVVTGNEKAIFNVIIPPDGGHGYNIYNELGAYRVLIYSRIENNPANPDFIIGNQFSRVGIIKDIYSKSSSSLFKENTGSGVYALKMNEDVTEDYDSTIIQPSTGAVGVLVSYDNTTKVLRYIQTRYQNIDTYKDSGNNVQINYPGPGYITGINTVTNYQTVEFDNSNITIGSNTYTINSTFGGTTGTNAVTVSGTDYYLGQTFYNGVSKPDINTKSGEIIYVDNRVSVTRSPQQREDIKIILEF